MRNLLDVSAAILFAASFFAAAVSDLRTWRIPDCCHAGLLIAGVLRIWSGAAEFLPSLGSLVFTGGLLLVLSLWRDGLGGGDVKLCASSAFVLGVRDTFGALTVSLLLALGWLLLRLKIWPEKGERLALAPFLAIGFIWMLFTKTSIRYS